MLSPFRYDVTAPKSVTAEYHFFRTRLSLMLLLASEAGGYSIWKRCHKQATHCCSLVQYPRVFKCLGLYRDYHFIKVKGYHSVARLGFRLQSGSQRCPLGEKTALNSTRDPKPQVEGSSPHGHAKKEL